MNDAKHITYYHLLAQIRAGLSLLTLRRLRQGQTLAELAAEIEKNDEWWKQVLNGDIELTERELAEMAYALDAEIEINLKP